MSNVEHESQKINDFFKRFTSIDYDNAFALWVTRNENIYEKINDRSNNYLNSDNSMFIKQNAQQDSLNALTNAMLDLKIKYIFKFKSLITFTDKTSIEIFCLL